VPRAVVIIDSISAYCDEKEQNEGVEAETRGGGAKLFSRFCRQMNQIVPVNQSIVIGITHLICNTGGGVGPRYFERAARMWLYQKDYDLKAVMRTPWKVGDRQIGFIIKWVSNTSKTMTPGLTIDGYLRFGVGFEKLYELITLGIAANIIKKAGAWYSLAFIKDSPKFQGAENLYEALSHNTEWQNQLEKLVMEMAGGLVNNSGEE
jgi:recombination protein RecA